MKRRLTAHRDGRGDLLAALVARRAAEQNGETKLPSVIPEAAPVAIPAPSGKALYGDVSGCQTDDVKRPFNPLPHQLATTEYFFSSGVKGMLLYHNLGSGKTCLAYMIADRFISEGKTPTNPDGPMVHVLLPASLKETHRREYCTLCGQDNLRYPKNYRMHSYNAGDYTVQDMPKVDMSNSLIVIDEVQNIVNGIANGSASFLAVQSAVRMALKAERTRVILLSGTPLYAIDQVGILFGLIGVHVPDSAAIIFSNTLRFQEKIHPYVSFNPGSGTSTEDDINEDPPLEIPARAGYPKKIDGGTFLIPMSPYQYATYDTVRSKERADLAKLLNRYEEALRTGQTELAKQLKSRIYLKIAAVQSRKICNFTYPVVDTQSGIQLFGDNITPKSEDGNDDKLLKKVNTLLKEHNVFKRELPDQQIPRTLMDIYLEGLKSYSSKLAYMALFILRHPYTKHCIFGGLLNQHGLFMISNVLEHCGVRCLRYYGSAKSRGSLQTYNDVKNARGEYYPVILISKAGTTGITIKGVRYFHNFEPMANDYLNFQAEGRVYRTGSHDQLPEEERTVTMFRYITAMPITDDNKIQVLGTEVQSTEEGLYNKAIYNRRQTAKLCDLIKRSAVDAGSHFEAGTYYAPGQADQRMQEIDLTALHDDALVLIGKIMAEPYSTVPNSHRVGAYFTVSNNSNTVAPQAYSRNLAEARRIVQMPGVGTVLPQMEVDPERQEQLRQELPKINLTSNVGNNLFM